MKFNPFNIILLLFTTVFLVRCGSSSREFENPEQGFVSWKPAPEWQDALLSGNGTMGTMVFGDPHEETLIVNHALHYLPNWTPQEPIDQASRLDEIRALLSEGRYHEAAKIPVEQSMEEGYGEKKWIDPFVPFCHIDLSMPAGNIQNYRRMVDFRTGEAKVEWEQDGEHLQRSLFVSRPDSLIVMRITGSDEVSASLRLKQHPVDWDQWDDINRAIKNVQTSAKDGYLTYSTEFQRKWGENPDGFEGVARVVPSGGETSYEDDRMIIENAEEILVLMRVVPNYDFDRSLTGELKSVLAGYETAYEELLHDHKQEHGDLFGRVNLDLGDLGEGSSVENLQSEAFVHKAREKTTP
ncbi:MAG: glycoside hydrolase N-terminal domain-containing protein, partial [Marinilabiliaceae bacterium]